MLYMSQITDQILSMSNDILLQFKHTFFFFFLQQPVLIFDFRQQVYTEYSTI